MKDKQIPSQINRAINPSMHVNMAQGPPSGGHNTTNMNASVNCLGGVESNSEDSNSTNGSLVLGIERVGLTVLRFLSGNDDIVII